MRQCETSTKQGRLNFKMQGQACHETYDLRGYSVCGKFATTHAIHS